MTSHIKKTPKLWHKTRYLWAKLFEHRPRKQSGSYVYKTTTTGAFTSFRVDTNVFVIWPIQIREIFVDAPRKYPDKSTPDAI